MKKLLIVSLSGKRYGIWKDDLLEVKKIKSVHGPILGHESFFGFAETEDGRTTTLFDLGICMGHGAVDRHSPGTALITSTGESAGGFITCGEPEEVELDDGEVFPLPEYLDAPELCGCVVHLGELLPIINVVSIFGSIRDKARKRPSFRLVSAARKPDLSSTHEFRVFELGGRTFAVPDELIDAQAKEPGLIRKIPFAPPYVDGIVLNNGRIAIVLNLAKYIDLNDAPSSEQLFFTKCGSLAFLAGSDTRALSVNVGPRRMPPLASSDLIEFGIVRDGDIIPVLNVHAALTDSGKTVSPKGHNTSPVFASSFMKEDVEVREFSLQNMRHYLPFSQVEDTVDFKPCLKIPGTRSIVSGVVEHMGEILPVVDVSLCFDNGSRTTSAPKMILIRNGDFRGFFMADSVSEGPLSLPVEGQRKLPVRQKAEYVYGCYLDGQKIRLILNVEALTTHFVKKDVRSCFGYKTTDPEEVAAKDAPRVDGSPDRLKEDTVQNEYGISVAPGVFQQTAEKDELEEINERLINVEDAREPCRDIDEQTSTVAPADDQAGKFADSIETGFPVNLALPEETDTDQAKASAAKEKHSKLVLKSDAEQHEKVLSEAIEQPALEELEPEEILPDWREAEGSEHCLSEAGIDEPAYASRETECKGIKEGENNGHKDDSEGDFCHGEENVPLKMKNEAQELEMSEQEEIKPEELPSSYNAENQISEKEPAEEKIGLEELSENQKQSTRVAYHAHQSHDGLTEDISREELVSPAKGGEYGAGADHAGPEPSQSETGPDEVPFSVDTETQQEPDNLPGAPHPDTRPEGKLLDSGSGRKTRSRGIYAATVLLAAFAAYLSVGLIGTNTGNEAGMEPVENKLHNAASIEGAAIEAKKEVALVTEKTAASESGSTAKVPEASTEEAFLLLEITPGKEEISIHKTDTAPADATSYVIVKGDTLWHISKRFTGDPFKYNTIATNNEIHDPDLIYPDEKILIRINE